MGTSKFEMDAGWTVDAGHPHKEKSIPLNSMRFDLVRFENGEKMHLYISDARPRTGNVSREPKRFQNTTRSHCSHFVSNSVYPMRNYYLMLLLRSAVIGQHSGYLMAWSKQKKKLVTSLSTGYRTPDERMAITQSFAYIMNLIEMRWRQRERERWRGRSRTRHNCLEWLDSMSNGERVDLIESPHIDARCSQCGMRLWTIFRHRKWKGANCSIWNPIHCTFAL